MTDPQDLERLDRVRSLVVALLHSDVWMTINWGRTNIVAEAAMLDHLIQSSTFAVDPKPKEPSDGEPPAEAEPDA